MTFARLLATICTSLMLVGCYGGEAIRLHIRSASQGSSTPATKRVAEQTQVFSIVRAVALQYGLTAQPHGGVEPFADAYYSIELRRGPFGTSRVSPTVVVTSTRGDILAIASVLASPGRELELGARIAADLERRLAARFGAGRVRVRRESLTNAF